MSNKQEPADEQQVVPFFRAWEAYLTEIKSILKGSRESKLRGLSSKKFATLTEVDKHFNISIKPLLENFFARNPLIHEGIGSAEDLEIYQRYIKSTWHPLSIELLPPRVKTAGLPLESEESIQKALKKYQEDQKKYWEKKKDSYHSPYSGIVTLHPYPRVFDFHRWLDGVEYEMNHYTGKYCKEAIKALVEREKTIMLEQNKKRELNQAGKEEQVAGTGKGEKVVKWIKEVLKDAASQVLAHWIKLIIIITIIGIIAWTAPNLLNKIKPLISSLQ